jgi:hypothetical protein
VQTIGRPGKAASGRIEHIGAETGFFSTSALPEMLLPIQSMSVSGVGSTRTGRRQLISGAPS